MIAVNLDVLSLGSLSRAAALLARRSDVIETFPVAVLVEDALRFFHEPERALNVRLFRRFASVPPVTLGRNKVLQILVNLLRNAPRV